MLPGENIKRSISMFLTASSALVDTSSTIHPNSGSCFHAPFSGTFSTGNLANLYDHHIPEITCVEMSDFSPVRGLCARLSSTMLPHQRSLSPSPDNTHVPRTWDPQHSLLNLVPDLLGNAHSLCGKTAVHRLVYSAVGLGVELAGSKRIQVTTGRLWILLFFWVWSICFAFVGFGRGDIEIAHLKASVSSREWRGTEAVIADWREQP